MVGKEIQVSVVGKGGEERIALIDRIKEQGGKVGMRWQEVEDVRKVEKEEQDVVLEMVDATKLEEDLLQTPILIEKHLKLVIGIYKYEELLATEHWLETEKLSSLIGVPIEVLKKDDGESIEKLIGLIGETAKVEKPHADEHPIYRGWEQKDEDAYMAHIHGALTETLHHSKDDKHNTPLEKIDKVLTNRWIGFPILGVVMTFVFWVTFALGGPIQEWLQMGVDGLYEWLKEVMKEGWLCSLLADGVVRGVGSLLTALPNIIILFFFLSVMEDTGYMSRVSYLMDGVMHRLGLHGRSFIPMLMGFDCNVPAIMAAKDIMDKKERTMTMLMVPFMSCSARLPVYILFTSVFFKSYKALVLGSLYLLGILLSFAFAAMMKHTEWFKKEDDVSVNELPPFRIPTMRSIGGHIWYRVEDFLKKISTVVLCASIVIWALEYFPAHDLEHLETSWLAWIGKGIEPLMAPLGFDWKMSVCLLTGLPAKEAIASTFAILFSNGLATAAFTPVSAYAFLIFTLLYFPCVATITTLRREINWKWAMFSAINSIVLAWVMAFVVFQIGSLL